MTNLSLMGTFLSATLIAVMTSLPLSFAQEQVGITKTATDSYFIKDDGAELVGAFDKVYTITGSSNSLNKSKDSIISIIQDDFDNSPTTGYIRLANITDVLGAISNQTGPEIRLPFVDQLTANSTITQELTDSIDSAFGRNLTTVTIKCDFGMNIKDWQCKNHGISQ